MENQIVIYQTDKGQTAIDVRLENETVWLTQAQMAMLFQKDQSVIARHIANVFKEGELDRNSNMQILHNTLSKYKPTTIYNLDVIISVGYRVKSQRGVQFRQWANKVLKDYLLKGYAVNEKIRRSQIGELRQLVQMVGRTIQNQPLLKNDENQALSTFGCERNHARGEVSSDLRQRHASHSGITREVWRKFAVRQRERRLFQKQYWSNLSDFWR